MAIKVIPQEEISQVSRWLSFLFVLSIIFFLVSLLSYFLIVGLIGKTKEDIENLKTTLAARSEEQRVLEEKILSYQQKISDFAPLLKTHKKPSNFFQILEDVSHPQVWFTGLKLDSQKAIINLEGETQSFQTLSQQQELLNLNPSFKEVNLQTVSLIEGGKVKFVLSIVLDPQLLTQ